MNQKQYDAIELIILGLSDSAVGEKVGVSRQTVNSWRNQDAEFIAELNLRRQEIWNNSLDKFRQLPNIAVDIIFNDLQSEDETIRRNAAYFIVKQINLKDFIEPSGETNPKKITYEKMLENW